MTPEEAINEFKERITLIEKYGYVDLAPEFTEAMKVAISALEKQEQDRWRPCNEKPEYDFQNVLVRWHDKRKGCKDYYIFEGYVVRGIWCGLFEDADISNFEPIGNRLNPTRR